MIIIHFYLQVATLNKGKGRLRRLCVRFGYKNCFSTMSTPFHLYFDEWDTKRQCVVVSGKHPKRASRLEQIGEEVKGIHDRLRVELEKKLYYKVVDAADSYRQQDKHVMREFVEKFCQKESGSDPAYSRYLTSLKHLQNMIGHEPYFEDITTDLLNRFDQYLENAGLQPNGRYRYMLAIRTVYDKGLRAQMFVPTEDNLLESQKKTQMLEKRPLNRVDMVASEDMD